MTATLPRAGRRRMTARTRWRVRWESWRHGTQPILVLAAAIVIASIVSLVFDTREARTEAAVVTEQRDDTAEQAVNLAAQIQAACRTDELDGPVCQTAARVVATPVPGDPGLPGADGPPGVDGRGVAGTSIVDGRLLVAYSDGSTQDVGLVMGRDGAPGVGITATTIEDGQLVVLYSDDRRVTVGPVVGATGSPGRGVQSVASDDGRLRVTYTDGTVDDAGPLPAGPAGATGATGATGDMGPRGEPAPTVQSETRTFSDGSTQRCTRSGGSDANPEFDCQTTPPPVPEEVGTPLDFVGG